MTPNDLLYAKTHEWVKVDNAAKVATIGVSAFAVEALTDLVYIELPAVGKTVKAGEPFGEIESVKAVSDLYSPVTGEVIEVNSGLASDLGVLNEDPYTKGWMIKVRLVDESSLSKLLNAADYEKQCSEDAH
ncbi:MAG: glycine cleavage system protein GcvH [Planctomycetia bacterium]|nr:glycine cleavage system protein GcvH [Planctomycetia bacterium]